MMSIVPLTAAFLLLCSGSCIAQSAVRFGLDLTIPVYTVSEGDGPVEICVVVTEGSTGGQQVIISPTLTPISTYITAGADYDPNVPDLVFAGISAVGSIKCFDLIILDDSIVESTETLTVGLTTTASSVTFGPIPEATLVITEDNLDTVKITWQSILYPPVESDGQKILCADLFDGSLERSISAYVSTSDGTAYSGSDYTPLISHELIYQPSTSFTQCVQLLIHDDNLLEGAEWLLATLSATDNHIEITFDSTNITIMDDTVSITWEFDSYTTPESEDVMVCAKLVDQELLIGISVFATFTANTAEENKDYQAGTYTMEFNPGQSYSNSPLQCITLTIIDDLIVEDPELFSLTLYPSPGYEHLVKITGSPTTITIEDDDSVTFDFQYNNVTLREGEDLQYEVCVEVIDGLLERPVNFVLDTQSNTAVGGKDYTDFISTVVPIPVGSTVGTLVCTTLFVTNDNILEDTEQLSIYLSSNDIAAIIPHGMSSYTILEDPYDIVTVGMETATYTWNEPQQAIACAEIMASGVQSLERSVAVIVFLSDETAYEGNDYVALSSLELTFTAGQAVGSKECINMEVLDDLIVEEDFETFTISVTSSTVDADVLQFENSISQVSIMEDDDTVTVGLQHSAYAELEDGNGAYVCAELLAGSLPLEREVTVQFTTNLATSSSLDLQLLNLFTLTFTYGQQDGDLQCTTILFTKDTIVEYNETFSVELSTVDSHVALGGQTTAIVTILDDDFVEVQVDDTTLITTERLDTSVLVCFSQISGSQDRPITYYTSTSDVTAMDGYDYLYHDNGVINMYQVSTLCHTIHILDNTALEYTETLMFVLTTDDPGVKITGNTTIIVINEDPIDDVEVSLVEVSYYGTEEIDSYITVYAAIIRGVLERNISVLFESSDGSAEAGKDFQAVSTEVVFTAGQRAGSVSCAKVPLLDGTVVEDTEQFTIQMSSDSGVVIVGAIPSVTSVDLTIYEDPNDYVVVQSDKDDYVGEEGTSVTACVLLYGELERDVMLQLSTMDGTAIAGDDYISVQQYPFTFQSGQNTGDSLCTQVNIVDAADIEYEEWFTFYLTTNDHAVNLTADAVSNIIIPQDEKDYAVIQFTAYSYLTGENADKTFVDAGVWISSSTATLLRPVTITLTTEEQTATGGIDFVPLDQFDITFPAYSPVGTQINKAIEILPDSLLEADPEILKLILNTTDLPAVVLGVPSEATVLITEHNADEINVALTSSSYVVIEDIGSLEVCAEIVFGSLQKDVQVLLSTSPISATGNVDYDSFVGFTLTLTSGQSAGDVQCTDLIVTVDSMVETSETLTIHLATQDVDVILIEPNVATITIIDDDVLELGFTETSVVSVEQDAEVLTFCVEILSGSLERPVNISIETQSITATDGADYIGYAQELTFAAGSVEGDALCLSVAILDDHILESDERFTVTFTVDPANAAIADGRQTVDVAIAEDENESVAIDFKEASILVTEGVDSNATICLLFSQGSLGREIDFLISIQEGTATSDDFVNGVLYTVTFSSGQMAPTEHCIVLQLIDDNIVESVESFSALLSTTDPGVALSTSTTTVTLFDDPNDVFTVELNSVLYSVSESDQSLEVCVVSSGFLERDITIFMSTIDQTATSLTEPYDYSPSLMNKPLVFTPGQQSSGSSSICSLFFVVNDTILENNELFYVKLTSNDSAVDLVTDSAPVFIVEDSDVVEVALTNLQYEATEGMNQYVEVCAVSNLLERDVVVTMTTMSGTAIDGEDFTGVDTHLTFVGNTGMFGQHCVQIPLLDGECLEDIETFSVVLTSDDAGADFTVETATVQILEDPSDYVELYMMLTDLSLQEESGGGIGTETDICIGTRRCLNRDIDFEFAVVSGTAVTGKDLYSGASTDPLCIAITTIPDAILEDDEQLTVLIHSQNAAFTISSEESFTNITIQDNDFIEVSFENSLYVTDESSSNVNVCIEMVDGELERDVVIELTTISLISDEPLDFELLLSKPITFVYGQSASGSNKQCLDIGIVNDNILEGNENFSLQITAADAKVAHVIRGNAIVNIIEDISDSVEIGLSDELFIVEENEAFDVCIEIFTGTLQREVLVTLTTQPLTATADVDYPSLNMELKLDPIFDFNCINVTILDDTCLEDSEFFFLVLSSLEPAVVLVSGRSTISVEIQEDMDYVEVELDSSVHTILSEDDGVYDGGSVEICVLATSCFERDFVIELETSPITAVSGEDYSLLDAKIQFNPMTTWGCIDVFADYDEILEYDEQFALRIVPSDAILNPLDPNSTTITIIDNDFVEIGLSKETYVVQEDTNFIEVCVEVSNGTLQRSVVVTLTTNPHSATADVDYSSINSELTFDPITYTNCVNITILDDTCLEDSEFFYLVLSSLEPTVVLVPGRNTLSVEIQEDMDYVEVELESSLHTILSEDDGVNDGGSVEICVLATSCFERNFTVELETSPITAVYGNDYSLLNEHITFTPMTTRGCIGVFAEYDEILEYNEQFALRIVPSDAILNPLDPNSTTITIIDNDYVEVFFDNSSYTISMEDGSGPSINGTVEACVLLDGSIERPAPFNIYTTAGSANADSDFMTVSINETFLYGGPNRICLNLTSYYDTILEHNEYFYVNLQQLDSDVHTIYPSSADVFITDNDYVEVGIQLSEYVISEGGSGVQVCAELVFGVLERNVSVELTTSPGTANGTYDYSPLDNLVLTFSTGLSAPSFQCAIVKILDDTILEGNQSFSVILSALSNPQVVHIPQGMDVSEITIREDNIDYVEVAFEKDFYLVSDEAQWLQVCIVIVKGELERTVTVELDTIANNNHTNEPLDSDILESHMLHFLPGQSSYPPNNKQCELITIINDDIVEGNETFELTLSTTLYPKVVIATSNTTVFINPGFVDTVAIGFSEELYMVQEGDGSVEVCVNIDSGSLQREVVVSLATYPNTAEASVDFSPLSADITFGATTSQHCLEISILDDTCLEDTQNFYVALSSTDRAVTFTPGRQNSSVDILEDMDYVEVKLDSASHTILSEDDTMGSGNSVEVCLLVTGCFERNVTVDLATSPITAVYGRDYPLQDTQVVFVPPEYGASGMGLPSCSSGSDSGSGSGSGSGDCNEEPPTTQLCIDVFAAHDEILEYDEEFALRIVPSDAALKPLDPNTTTITIIDNDYVSIGLAGNKYQTTDDAGYVKVCAELVDGELERPVTVLMTTMDGTATASSFADYVPLMSEELNFISGQSDHMDRAQCLNLTIMDDTILENTEEFYAHLSYTPMEDRAVVFISPLNSNSTIYIQEDQSDSVEIGFLQLQYSITECDQCTLEVCVGLLEGTLERSVTVKVESQDGSSEYGLDYDVVYLNRTLNESQSVSCFDVTMLDDTCLEPSQNFSLHLSSYEDAVMVEDHQSTTVTILEDSLDFVEVSLHKQAYRIIDEDDGSGDGGRIVVCTVLQGCLHRQAPFHFFTQDDTASEGFDYVPVNLTLNFDYESTSPSGSGSGSGSGDMLFIHGGSGDSPYISSGDYSSGFVSLLEEDDHICVIINSQFDSILEYNEQFSIFLDMLDPAVHIEQPSNSTITIIDNDYVEVGMQYSEYITTEGEGSLQVCVEVVSGVLERNISVELSTYSGTASLQDYWSLNAETLIFQSGQVLQCIYVNIIDDSVLEWNETFSIKLNTSLTSIVRIVSEESSITILEDDVDSVEMNMHSMSLIASECDCNISICVEFTDGILERNVSVSLSTEQGTATSPDDFLGIHSRELQLTRENTAGDLICTELSLVEDMKTEYVEHLTVELQGVEERIVLVGTRNYSSVAIVDNDVVEVGLEPGDFESNEIHGGTDTVTACVAMKTGALERTVQIDLLTIDSGYCKAGFDYDIPSPPYVSFLPGETGGVKRCFNITVLDDVILEDVEYFTLMIQPSSADDSESSVQVLAKLDAVGMSIAEDPLDGVIIGLSSTKFKGYESNGYVQICAVIVEGHLERNVSVELQTVKTSKDSATIFDDFSPITNEVLVFLPGSTAGTEVCFDLAVVDDDIIEKDEILEIELTTDEDNVVGLGVTRANVTIEDAGNDKLYLTMNVTSTNVSEEAGMGTEQVCVQRSPAVMEKEVVAFISTVNETASAGEDYIPLENEPLVFDNSVFVICHDLLTMDDSKVEGIETFGLVLKSDDPAAVITNDYIQVSIIEQDRESNFTALVIVVILVLVFLILICIVFCIIMCFYCRSRRGKYTLGKNYGGDLSLPNTYVMTDMLTDTLSYKKPDMEEVNVIPNPIFEVTPPCDDDDDDDDGREEKTPL